MPRRPSPSKSATAYTPGARQLGNDDQVWIVVVNKNGVHRWAPATQVMPSFRKRREKERNERRRRKQGVGAAKTTPTKGAAARSWIRENRAVFARAIKATPVKARPALEAAVRDQVALFGALTGRNQDFGDARIAAASTRELRDTLGWYLSDEGRAVLVTPLAAVALLR